MSKASDLALLAVELEKIDAAMLRGEKHFHHLIDQVHPRQKRNAINLLHYLALRSLDIRDLQDRLHDAGLSSLASSESHARGQLLAIMQHLGRKKAIPAQVFSASSSKKSTLNKSIELFGTRPVETVPYIMVTFDTSLADDEDQVRNLLEAGMNIARINCAHDDEIIWLKMIRQIRKAEYATGLKCKIYMDLAGPKIRTVVKKNKKFRVAEGELIYLTDESYKEKKKRTIRCTVPGIADQLRPGETVLFDDGLIEAHVEQKKKSRVLLRVVRISSQKPFIRHEKGINFPDSHLQLPALTAYDRKCLPFIQEHADLVGYSFVRNPKDIIELREALKVDRKPGLILKIETPEAVRNFPDLLFSGMREEHIGVMIARGDLAVEIGFERMSEIQEEILWICEAAHVPVIWATQVLESLNKSGMATRSEITDAAHAVQADCVMINKGVHIIRTLEVLRDIMIRSGGHHAKKRYTFRPLTIASRFMDTHPPERPGTYL